MIEKQLTCLKEETFKKRINWNIRRNLWENSFRLCINIDNHALTIFCRLFPVRSKIFLFFLKALIFLKWNFIKKNKWVFRFRLDLTIGNRLLRRLTLYFIFNCWNMREIKHGIERKIESFKRWNIVWTNNNTLTILSF